MDAFPAFFPLAGRTVIVAGEGEAAAARVRLFEGSPATIVRLDHEAALKPEAYAGAVLAFIGDGAEPFLKAAADAARVAGVPVNVTDRPALCDFATPALIDRGAVVAAVGTAGASPILASMLRNDIEARVPEGVGRVAALLGGLQDEIRRAAPDLSRRRAFLRRAIDGPAAQAAMDGDMTAAQRLLRAALADIDTTALAGRITLIIGDGPADLLSLRAIRALGQADAVVADEGCTPEILGMARRDATRPAADAAVSALAGMIEDGQHVVWLTTATKARDRRRMLAETRAPVEILTSGSADQDLLTPARSPPPAPRRPG